LAHSGFVEHRISRIWKYGDRLSLKAEIRLSKGKPRRFALETVSKVLTDESKSLEELHPENWSRSLSDNEARKSSRAF
jgi:hypothetical protein